MSSISAVMMSKRMKIRLLELRPEPSREVNKSQSWGRILCSEREKEEEGREEDLRAEARRELMRTLMKNNCHRILSTQLILSQLCTMCLTGLRQGAAMMVSLNKSRAKRTKRWRSGLRSSCRKAAASKNRQVQTSTKARPQIKRTNHHLQQHLTKTHPS